MESDTIAAIATPGGTGGIGIIKISGPDALGIAAQVFRPGKADPDPPGKAVKPTLDNWPSHRVRYGRIHHPQSGSVIDEVLLNPMRAPGTYTGEDVVEINAHGGPVVLQSILESVIATGARLAEPGEFTRRAFLNGRIDLTQAEAVADLIAARCDGALAMATEQMGGALRRAVERIRSALMELRARIEAAVDFPDAVDEIVDPNVSTDDLRERVVLPLLKIRRGYDTGRVLRQGVRCTILGKPNVGKSSLMNRLLDRERVIVTPVPGTTRDWVEESLDIGGFPVILTDTAGIHDSQDPVERVGIEEARSIAARSDMILFVVDGSRELTRADFSNRKIALEKPMILVVNKIDLMETPPRISLPDSWRENEAVYVSAKNGDGLDVLQETLAHRIFERSGFPSREAGLAPNLRQKLCVDQVLDSVDRLTRGLETAVSEELLAIEIREAVSGLDRMVGLETDDDVLDEVFQRFCIGK